MSNVQNNSFRLSNLIDRREILIQINGSLANLYFGNDALIAKKKNKLQELLQILNTERRSIEYQQVKEHKNSETHKMLMSTKGLNGRQILMLNR